MTDAPDTTLTLPPLPLREERPCATCGGRVILKLPVGAPDWLVRGAGMQLSGRVEIECEKCVSTREREAQDAERRERRERLLSRRLSNSMIPEKWQSATFEDVDVDVKRKAAISAAQEWGQGKRRGLLMH